MPGTAPRRRAPARPRPGDDLAGRPRGPRRGRAAPRAMAAEGRRRRDARGGRRRARLAPQRLVGLLVTLHSKDRSPAPPGKDADSRNTPGISRIEDAAWR